MPSKTCSPSFHNILSVARTSSPFGQADCGRCSPPSSPLIFDPPIASHRYSLDDGLRGEINTACWRHRPGVEPAIAITHPIAANPPLNHDIVALIAPRLPPCLLAGTTAPGFEVYRSAPFHGRPRSRRLCEVAVDVDDHPAG